MAFKKKIKTMRVDTLIGKNSKIVGDILYTGGVHVEGEVEGNLMAREENRLSPLRVSAHARNDHRC